MEIHLICPNDFNPTTVIGTEMSDPVTSEYWDRLADGLVWVSQTSPGFVTGWNLGDGCYISAEEHRIIVRLALNGMSTAEFVARIEDDNA